MMSKVLGIIAKSPFACSFSIALGVGILLSVAYLDPTDIAAIQVRQVAGGVFVLLPGISQRFVPDEY
jgi:hypothetical protein